MDVTEEMSSLLQMLSVCERDLFNGVHVNGKQMKDKLLRLVPRIKNTLYTEKDCAALVKSFCAIYKFKIINMLKENHFNKNRKLVS